MVHVHAIKSPFHIVLGAPIPILGISGNIILWFIYSLVLNIVKYLNINLFEVPYFSVGFGEGLGSVTSSSLKFFKGRSFVFYLT